MIGASILALALSIAQQADESEGQTAAAPQAGPVLSLGAEPAPPREDELLETASTYAAFHSEVNAAGQRELRSGLDLDTTMDALAA